MKINLLINLKRRILIALFVFVAPMMALAQSSEVNIYMKDGTQIVDSESGMTYNFYDSHGASSGPASYWDRWYNHNEEFIFTFKPASPNYKIKVAFQTFTAYTDNDGTTDPEALPDQWALRLNDDYLYVYEGEGISNAKLIASYTGNTKQAFTVMSTESTGALTFYFRSNERYREEGWHAIVTEEPAAAPQAPFIRRSTCDNEIELLPTTLKAKSYYLITSEPVTPAQIIANGFLYTAPIEFSSAMTVKAVSVLSSGGDPSDVVSTSFTPDDLLKTPAKPDVDRTPENMVVMKAPKVPSGLNETYVVRYTMAVGADPEEPELRNSTLYTEPFAITEPDTRIKARTFAVSCNNWFSDVKDVIYSKINSPLPVISFTDNKITAQLNGEDYDILYTTDGSEPSIDPRHGIHGGPGTMALNNIIHLGMTIKALAYKEGNANYTPSAVVSAIYAPGSGVEDYGDIVLLDDREDHSWSYYSDSLQPIHSLKPADIKITYYGNGENNMTNGSEIGDDPNTFSDDASGVKVGVDATEGQNTFIYLKTLENDNPDGSTSNNTYSYTTIPNPFQVRPVSNDFTPDPDPIAEVNLGRYTTTSVMLPTQTESAYSVTQQIYTKDEIGRSGQINGITFYATADNGPARDLTVYLMETSKASFTSNTDWVDMTSATEVFDGTVTVGTTTAITFTTPFEYTGSNNLLICVYDHTESGAAASTFYTYPTTARSLCADGSSDYDLTNLSGVTGSPLDCNDQIDFVFDGGYTYSNSTREISSGLLTLHTPELPLNNSYNYNQTAQVYTPSEVGAAGEITSIAFHVNNLRSATRHLRIYLFYYNNVNLTSNDPSTLFNGEYIPANYQFDGTITFTSNGWTTIPLTTPFNYDGNHNLVVLVQDMTGSASSLLSVLFFTRYNTLRASSIHSRQYSEYDGSDGNWNLPTLGIRTGYNNCVRFGIRTASHNPDTHLTLGNRSESEFIPVATGTNYSVSQQIVTADEIDRNAGAIKSITLYSNGSASRSLSIYLKHTSKDRFENESDWISMKSSDLVYSGEVSFNGSTTIDFSSDFAYDGTRNIVVCIVDNTGLTSNISFSTFTSSNSKRTLYGQSGSSIDVTTFSEIGTLSNERSQMTLNSGLRGEDPRAILADADKWRGFYKWRVKRLSSGLTIKSKDGLTTYSKGDMIPAETEIKFVTDKAEGNEVEFEALWAKAYVTTNTSTSGLNTNVGYERNFMVLSSSTSFDNPEIAYGSTTNNGQNVPLYTNSNRNSVSQQIYLAEEINHGPQTITRIAFRVKTSGNSNRTLHIYLTHSTTDTYGSTSTIAIPNGTTPVYSGQFNFSSTGWKIITLTNPFEYDGSSNLVLTVFDATGSSSGTNLLFYTASSSSYQAVYKGGTSAYTETGSAITGCTRIQDRPTVRFTFDDFTMPVTITTYNPDGTGVSSNVSIGKDISIQNDLKIENIKMDEVPVLNGNGHTLVIGRGVTALTSGTMCATEVYGKDFSASVTENPSINLRIESGAFTNIYVLGNSNYNTSNRLITGTANVRVTLGSDYDRAKDANNLFSTTRFTLGMGVRITGADSQHNIIVKSGTIGTYSEGSHGGRLYLGFDAAVTDSEHRLGTYNRYVEVLGGIFHGDVGGGANGYSGISTNPNELAIRARIKGGIFNYRTYMGGTMLQSFGDKCMIATGGTFANIIAGGCYGSTQGTGYQSGSTLGSTKVYFGGKANQTDDGGLFGSGYGAHEVYGGEYENSYYVQTSEVVIADQAQVGGNVYGGGNNGFAQNGSNVMILGGTIQGSVFGGSNKSKGAVVNVKQKGGLVQGSVYGGSNTKGVISGLATVTVSGGIMNDVFGGGYGENTNMAAGTNVTVSGGTLENVYGGSALGTVTGQTQVTIKEGGSVGDVYGAGMGDADHSATITGQTFVNISGGTVNGSVFGGGEAGDVEVGDHEIEPAIPSTDTTYGFEGNSLPVGWSATSWDLSTNNPAGGSYCLRASNVAEASAHWIITRKVLLGGTFSFQVRGSGSSGGIFPTDYSGYGRVEVWVSTTDNSTSSFEKVGATASTSSSYSTVERSLASYAGQEGYIAIKQYGNNNTTNGYVHVDNVRIVTPYVPAVTAPYDFASMVTVTGGTVEGDVYGGGKLGKTTGNDVVTINGGELKQNVFGGAYGAKDEVFLAGKKTVNIMNGKIVGSVYGGSRLANDHPNDFVDDEDFSDENDPNHNLTDPCIILNISGGEIDQQVYSAGYYGNTFGSVYTFIGLKASEAAPNAYRAPGVDYEKHKLIIKGNVWAGGDWGVFDGSTGFGKPTITGNSNIYIDGTGYKTNDKDQTQEYYMKLRGSLLGCGTSADAGKGTRLLVVKNFGEDLPNRSADKADSPFLASTEINSIQRWHNVRLGNSHIRILGQGRINSSNISETYSIYSIDESMYVADGSTLVMNSPADSLASFHSVTCDDIWNPTYTPVNYDELGDAGSATDNKLRINNGGYLKVKYGTQFGELEGFFHLMKGVDGNGAELYARPKQSTDEGNTIFSGFDNSSDGGFVSYDTGYNTYDASGGTVTAGVQVSYENHAPATDPNSSKFGEDYYRMWRDGGTQLKVARVLNAVADGDPTFAYKTVQVSVALPSWLSQGNYYRFDRDDEGNILVDYGNDVLTFNAANYQTSSEAPTGVPSDSEEWMSYSSEATPPEVTGQTSSEVADGLAKIDENKNLNFGLLVKPASGMSGSTHLICSETGTHLASLTDETVRYICSTTEQFDQTPTLNFVLTYSNLLSLTRTNDPILIPLVQCDGTTGEVLNHVTVSLTVATSTEITMGSKWEMYAFMDGNGSVKDRTSLRVEIPKFDVANSGQESVFTLKKAIFTETSTGGDVKVLKFEGDNVVEDTDPNHHNNYDYSYESNFGLNTFGFVMEPVVSENSSDTWRNPALSELDGATGNGSTLDLKIGENGGRSPLALDFTLIYNGNVDITGYTADIPLPRVPMGTLTLTVEFDNYKDAPDIYEGVENTDNKASFDIVVEIYRKGQARNFYLDGVNGKNIVSEHSGDYPDMAYKTMNFLLNRSDFLPGDNIYIVNTITMAKETTWNGDAKQSKVNVYRYPGGHELSNGQTTMEGFDNTALTDALVDVQKDLTINGMKFDGNKSTVTAEAPLFNVENSSTLSLLTEVTLQNNNNINGDGGAVHVDYGGTLKMNDNAKITGNVSAQGGGVFMDGKMIVSGNVQVTGNTSSTSTTTKSNVWLAPVASAGEDYRVLQVGTADNDGFGALESDAKIGVHKTDWGNGVDGYMPIVSSELGTAAYLDLPYQHPQTIIVPDVVNFPLEQYNDPNYLYWVSSWVTVQDHEPTSSSEDGGVAWTQSGNIGEEGSSVTITTPNQLAWVISLVNGENGQLANNFQNTTINLEADLDMSAHMWIPIGDENMAFKGTFDGKGHSITGIGSTVGGDFVGLFGQTDGATIKNVTVQVSFDSNADYIGTIAGKMEDGSLTNVGGAGNLTSENSSTANTIGGLVGTSTLTTIHSCYAATTIQGTSESTVGGLVGDNGSNLYNAYADVVLSEYNDASAIGGLVGYHRTGKTVENCYSVIHDEVFPGFAYTNSGTIQFCYTDKANDYVGSGNTPSGHGTYGATLDRKAIGYMYGDNAVTLASGTSTYVHGNTIDYTNKHTINWNGLLWTMNKWVTEKNAITESTSPYYHMDFVPWFRPTTKTINDDLPILGFANDNCLGTTDGKFLRYGSIDDNANGIDALLTAYNGQTASIFLYGNATDVKYTPSSGVKVFINEDACLIQFGSAGDFINTTVGVTFDNSCKTATDYFNQRLAYDWHLMSTSLKNAPIGASYSNKTGTDYTPNTSDPHSTSPVDISSLYNSYFPNGLTMGANITDGVKWDFYTYFEPEYHWINLKRNKKNHFHYDYDMNPGGTSVYQEDGEGHKYYQIAYNGDDQATNSTLDDKCVFIPGKGYMMAISQDSYMSSTGTLNKDNVTIKLTKTSHDPDLDLYDKGCNLIGNPYQAYLDLEEVSTTGYTTFYTYDADQNSYAPYTSGASVNPIIPSRYIHPHQAFFVQKTSDGDANFVFTPVMATTDTVAASYFRGDKVNYPLVNLFVINEEGAKSFAIVEVGRPELGGAERTEALKTTNFDLYAHYGDNNYKLLFTPENERRVPVFFKTQEDGQYTITWDTYHGQFSFLRLIDNIAGIECDMLATDHYTFEGHARDFAARFYLVFDNPGDDPMDEGDGENPLAFNDGYGWIVYGSGMLQLVDATGRVLYSQTLSGEMSRVNFDRFAAGVYVLRLIGKDVKTQKIVVK